MSNYVDASNNILEEIKRGCKNVLAARGLGLEILCFASCYEHLGDNVPGRIRERLLLRKFLPPAKLRSGLV